METPIALNVTPLNAPHRELEWQALADRDYQMMEVVLINIKYQIHLLNELKAKHINGTDILGIWDSFLPIFRLPQVNVFPDLIHQCSANYDPTQRVVLNSSSSVLFHITPEAIRQMLHLQTTMKLTPLSMMDLIDQGAKLSNAQITKINQLFLDSSSQTVRSPPISHVYLNDLGRDMVDMISYILGYSSTEYIDETILVLMAMFSPGRPPSVCYDYATYIANKMHEQLMNLDRERVFRYTSYIYHLLLFNQHDQFPFSVKRLDAQGNQRSVVFWSSIFHSVTFSPYNYCEFIDLFIHPVMSLLLSSPPPRLTDEMQKILQLSKVYNIGDWYFYQNHTVIRIYGCELAPYRLPRYVPMRLFALEYFKQFGNADMLHFHSKGKKAQLKIKNQLGPFIYNKREEA